MTSQLSTAAVGTFYEDFTVGDVVRHARGKTIGELDNVLITNMVMNTAQAHFNLDSRRDSAFPHILVFGGVTISMMVGLAMQDTAQNAIAELGMDGIRLRAPVTHGDTLYTYTEVLAKEAAPDSAGGVVTFRHLCVNQRDQLVCEGTRRVLVKCRDASR